MEDLIYLVPFLFIGLVILASSVFTIKQQTAGIVERFGKFNSVRMPGLHFKIPLVDKIAGKVSMFL